MTDDPLDEAACRLSMSAAALADLLLYFFFMRRLPSASRRLGVRRLYYSLRREGCTINL